MVPTDADMPDEPPCDNVTVPLKPRPDLLQVALGGNTSDGDTVRPAPKTRARSIPPVSRSKSKPRAKSLASTRFELGRQSRMEATVVGSFSKCSSIVSTMPKSKASILRDLSKLELDGHDLINVHVAGYFYVLRGDGMQEERCWSCQIPVDPNYPHRAGKVTFSTAKEKCFHWWLNHASPAQWGFFHDCETLGVTHDEIMLAVGIDLKTCPLPIGSALERIPKILPSHEAGHDPLLGGEPWFRKVAFPTIPSERKVPWAGNTWRLAPHPPAGPPPDHVQERLFFEGLSSG